MKTFYLDNAASTKVYNSVIKEMSKINSMVYANPSSMHELGEKALKEMTKAREIIARELNAKTWEIIFTSGGTESNNLVIQGLGKTYPNKKKIIISSIEHPSITETCKAMEKWGYKITRIPVNKEGIIDIKTLTKELDENTLLVSIMHVNNIIGSIQNIEEIGKLCRSKGVFFHTDAVQSYGKLEIDVKKMNLDFLSASAHKIGGAKGVGLLYIREGINISPIIYGGGQERGIRSGTENLSGIVGFSKAVLETRKVNKGRIKRVRDKLITGLEGIEGKINGSIKERIYNNIHVSFEGVESSALVTFLSTEGIYVSSGSACESKKETEDEVLNSIGLSKDLQKGSIRITLNEEIEEKDVSHIVREIDRAVKNLRV